ncbi:TerD family protein [Acaryochloris sp. 'Moss Beach']|uniref:TerD family protein n=1 Tax=Acaryochloris sp. 'Moss Beach' TaxID=2740837 RepID=UPI001F481A8F|nr:TerD family protein [Acaryochloris sp. 'Moss Beach']UJB70729.1 TerD family protein [Acaryochloris sp. 'Moss Beach']
MTPDSIPQALPHHIAQLRCGLGWDAQVESALDLDMVVLALGANGTLVEGKGGMIYAGHPRHSSGAIKLLGDNLTGEGEGDDEELLIHLLKLPTDITKLLFVVSIDCGEAQKQDFSQTENAFWRILNDANQEVLLQCSLSNAQWQGVTMLLVASLERMDTQWKLIPCLEPSPQKNRNELLHQYLAE